MASNLAHKIESANTPTITILVDNFSALGKSLAHYIDHHGNAAAGYAVCNKANDQYLWQFVKDEFNDFDYALNALLASFNCQHHIATPTIDSRIEHIFTIIEHDDLHHINLNKLAESVNLSASRLSHLFSSNIGMPLKSYLRYIRFKRLLPCLAEGQDLTQAAYNSGFSDAAHLSRECKKLFGIQPKVLKGQLSLEQI